MLFGVPARQGRHRQRRPTTRTASLNVALRDLRAEVGDATVVMADLCLDEFTDHGHCGVLDDDGAVDNDATLGGLRRRWPSRRPRPARTCSAPSGMMDGQVGVDPGGARRRRATATPAILAYTAKYASAFYGPFREAVE